MLAWLLAAALAAPDHDIMPADMFTLDAPGAFAVDRTGARVVFARQRWDRDLDRTAKDLWLLDTRSRASTRLTFTTSDEDQPVFSPDGTWIYYAGNDADGDRQVMRIPPTGGAAQPVTRAEDGIELWELSADGRAVYYTTDAEAPRDDAFKGLRTSHKGLEYGGAALKHQAVHRLDLGTWRTEPVYDPKAWIIDLSVSPDQRYLALLTAPDEALITHEGRSAVVIHDRTTGGDIRPDDALWRKQAPSPYGWLLGLAWSDDSRALAFRVDYDGYPGETFVTELAGAEPLTWVVPRPNEVDAEADDLAWVPDKRELCQRIADHGRVRILCTDGLKAQQAGRQRLFPEGNVVVRDYAFSGDGRDLVADVGTPERFAELYRLPARGQTLPVRLTELNPHTEGWKLPKMEIFTWTAPDGTPVEGILEVPYGWTKEQGPLPTLILIHGGPTAHAAFYRRFRAYGETLYAGRGWAVLQPNYRGSTGYGDRFLTDLVGRENDIEVKDILAGTDALIAAGVADAQRLAVAGWSNGGYLTGAVITATDRFKGASLGAGVVDQTLQWALEDTPGHVINFMQGQPWAVPDAYRHGSPLLQADRIRTPTIIHVGEDDPRVPVAHARAMYRALSEYLNVPSELVVYPKTGHGLRKISHLEAKMAWDIAWFDKYVLGVE